jgi:hypothetical protein
MEQFIEPMNKNYEGIRTYEYSMNSNINYIELNKVLNITPRGLMNENRLYL